MAAAPLVAFLPPLGAGAFLPFLPATGSSSLSSSPSSESWSGFPESAAAAAAKSAGSLCSIGLWCCSTERPHVCQSDERMQETVW